LRLPALSALMKFGSHKSPVSDSAKASIPITRRSSGLDQLFSAFPPNEGQSILDMSGASQANISFITGLGHRLSSDDVIATMEECFGPDFLAGQRAAANAQRFLDQTLRFPDQSFDAALVWDALQFLAPPLIDQVIGELLRVVKPGGFMLVFFNANERAPRLPVYNYRIQDQKNLIQVSRSSWQQGQFFPNRTVERLFEKAASLKFFLTRESSREIIVRR
jgi:SAM-dependent methyltransferase